MLGVQHHALSPPASKLNGITVLSPSTAAAKLQASPSLKNNSIKKTASPTTLDLEAASNADIASAWQDIAQEEVQVGSGGRMFQDSIAHQTELIHYGCTAVYWGHKIANP